jgi:hypothetical protein
MPLLFYWQPGNYIRDREFGFGFHLNQNSPAMATARPGDSVWAFTRRLRDGVYVLDAELVVRALTRNPPNYRYGRYRIWGDLHRSRYFDVDCGPNAEPLIRALSIRTRALRLGQSFQGARAVRQVSEADHRLLSHFALDLPVYPHAAIYPEDEFEARLVHGDAARGLVLRETRVESDRRLRYLYETVDIHRVRRNVQALHELYDGRCQICLFDPRTRYGHRLCHGHHIEWLSRGGEDVLENMVLVCPNHHAAIHRDDAPFDYANLAFTFANGLVEPLRLNLHLPRAA